MDWCEDPLAMGRVVCPKPRRAGPTYLNSPSMTVHMRDDTEFKSGAELLGLILHEEDFEAEQCTTLSSSPQFLFGSPPCRTSNPLVHDAHFGVEMLTSICKSPTGSAWPRLAQAGEQVGKKQAPIRVEGFNCQSIILLPRHSTVLPP